MEDKVHERDLKAKALDLEAKYLAEKEKALTAEIRFQERESARLEVEGTFRALKDQLRAESAVRQKEEDNTRAQERIAALEQRIDETHRLLIEFVREKSNPPSVRLPIQTDESVVERVSALKFEMMERSRRIYELEKEVNELKKNGIPGLASQGINDKFKLEEEVRSLTQENNSLRRQAELVNGHFAELAARYEQILKDKKDLMKKYEFQNAEISRYRFEELTGEIQNMVCVMEVISCSSALTPRPVVNTFHKMIAAKKRELIELSEVLSELGYDVGKPKSGQ